MSDVPRKMSSSGRSQCARVSRCLWAGDTHHVLIVIPLLSWNPSVRVTVPDSKLHGAAKRAGNWRRKSRQASVSGQRKHKVPLVAEGARLHLALFCIIQGSSHHCFQGRSSRKQPVCRLKGSLTKYNLKIHSPLWVRIVQKWHWQSSTSVLV